MKKIILVLALPLMLACGSKSPSSPPVADQDAIPPTVLQVTPARDSVGVSIGVSLAVVFSEPINTATLTEFSFSVTGVSGSISYNENTAFFTPAAPLSYSTTYTATITTGVKDLAGNSLASPYSWSFTTEADPIVPDTTRPYVDFVSPSAGSNYASINSTITILFSEPIKASSLDSSAILVSGVSGSISLSGSTAIFTPSSPLSYSTTYTATVSKNIADLAGNAMASDYVWFFTTEADPIVPDTTRPYVDFVSPSAGSNYASINSTITILFSEPIKASSIDNSAILVSGVSGSISLSGSMATFTPSLPLSYSTTYTVTVSKNIADLAGNAMASDYIWSFTTCLAPVTPANIVLKGQMVTKQDVFGQWHYLGEMVNTGGLPACFVDIEITFKDNAGAVIGSDFSYVNGTPMAWSGITTDNCLAAGEFGSFEVITALQELPAVATPAITWDSTQISELSVSPAYIIVDGGITESVDFWGDKVLSGTIKNNHSTKTVEFVTISFVGLNGAAVADIDYSYVAGSVCGSPTTDTCIGPGQTASFSVSLSEPPANITSYYYKISYLIN